ncbi:MAG: hypothetical protein GKS06_10010 [Acidobacteria bacterium]|nr:hypothetical protein [Acidobacteriota bacterium]
MLPDAQRRVLERWYLDAWLIAATRGLAQESYDRVRKEIADHFHQGLDDGVARGLEPADAAEAAIEGLGPARAARRSFRRTYLTTTQANLIRSFSGHGSPDDSFGWWRRRSRIVLAFCISAITVLLALSTPSTERLQGVDLLLICATCLGALAISFVPRIFRSGRAREAILLGVVAEAFVWGGYLFTVVDENRAFATGSLAVLLIAFAVGVVPIFRKLGPALATDATDPR